MAKKSKPPTKTKYFTEDGPEGYTVHKQIILYNIDDPEITRFEDSESYQDITDRMRFIPPASTTIINIKVTERNGDHFLRDILKYNDQAEFVNRNIKIVLKAKDMPQTIYLFGNHISVTNDYGLYEVKPALGNKVVLFPYSSISFKGSKAIYEGIVNQTIIEDKVIIGAGVHIPSYGMYIQEKAIVSNFNNFMYEGFVIGQGAYIASGLKKGTSPGGLKVAHDLYVTGPTNVIGRNVVIRGDVVLTGNIKIPAYANITGNVPLIFSGINFESIYLKATFQANEVVPLVDIGTLTTEDLI